MRTVGERLTKACAEESTLAEKLAKVKAISKMVSRLEQVANDEDMSGQQLKQLLPIEESDVLLNQEILPAIVTRAYAEENVTHQEESGLDKPIPAQAFLTQTFFILKDVQTEYKVANDRYERLRVKYAKLIGNKEKRILRRTTNAKKGIEKVEAVRGHGRERFLARRNQISRLRKGVKKIKVSRSEDNLPQVHTHGCHVIWAWELGTPAVTIDCNVGF